MEPASTIISKFGGEAQIATLLGIATPTPYNWRKPKEAGGTAGRIPQKYHHKLLDLAAERSIPLTASDLLPSREAA